MSTTRRLLVRLDAEGEREALLRFLRTHGCDAATADGPTDVAVDDCDRVEPGLATLVALIEEWRCTARVPEARLRLGDQETVLRTEI